MIDWINEHWSQVGIPQAYGVSPTEVRGNKQQPSAAQVKIMLLPATDLKEEGRKPSRVGSHARQHVIGPSVGKISGTGGKVGFDSGPDPMPVRRKRGAVVGTAGVGE